MIRNVQRFDASSVICNRQNILTSCPLRPLASIFRGMFTGIIETTGTIVRADRSGGACTLAIEPAGKNFSVRIGGSVAVDGVCLTLEKAQVTTLFFTAVQETIGRTTLGDLRPGMLVNLERALEFGGRLDGHLVLGHVDGVGTLASLKVAGRDTRYSIKPPPSCLRLIAEKGSVAVDGISLTVAAVRGPEIEIAVIPATLEATTLGRKKTGDTVNIECDVIARYCERLAQSAAPAVRKHEGSGSALYSALERQGFLT